MKLGYKYFNLEIYNDCIGKGFWFRVFGYGLSVSNTPPLFSERLGCTKVLRIFGVGVKVLKP